MYIVHSLQFQVYSQYFFSFFWMQSDRWEIRMNSMFENVALDDRSVDCASLQLCFRWLEPISKSQWCSEVIRGFREEILDELKYEKTAIRVVGLPGNFIHDADQSCAFKFEAFFVLFQVSHFKEIRNLHDSANRSSLQGNGKYNSHPGESAVRNYSPSNRGMSRR